MKVIPSAVRGLELDKARAKLNEIDLQFELKENRPPGKNKGTGKKRTVDLRNKKQGVFLIWSYEKYE